MVFKNWRNGEVNFSLRKVFLKEKSNFKRLTQQRSGSRRREQGGTVQQERDFHLILFLESFQMFYLTDVQLTMNKNNRNDEDPQKQYSVSTGRERHLGNKFEKVVGHWANSNPTKF